VADEETVERLKRGVAEWNAWRKAADEEAVKRAWRKAARPIGGLDLSDANLRNTDLGGADLRHADLTNADLHEADLASAILFGAELNDANLTNADLTNADLRVARLSRIDLRHADLTDANLRHADLTDANLHGASLVAANLSNANLSGANLSGANLSGAKLFKTIFGDVDLSGVIGLETCDHGGPSIIDHQTLQISKPLPLSFLRGVGLPDNLIDYLPSLLNQAIQHYSCFISYRAKDDDEEFAKPLHADLQNKGVRCWFAPHDLPIGEGILEGIDAAIRVRDKVLPILSEHSIRSGWVKDEVNTGFEEERKRGQNVLFPVRLDDAVMTTNEVWAAKLRARNIGDFRRWKDHDAYKQSFERVVRDLKVPRAK
jgi:uncharacterized protein YjbI with pentapeptide repeats